MMWWRNMKRPNRRPRRRWNECIKIDLKQKGWNGVDCINVAQDRDRWRARVNMVMNLLVP